ncbi:MBL fold metallo-hydrolase [Deinococcus sp. KNUC1210]|uniref:MBL fold metallo-hydrolase n=1 Tax=Deinococcus sp. KNUC1210 TaxID=2917691 RepID=UPI001EF11E8D|nr:MBL fold metallo-hydrolase [Deinococcus sp. KNUC1210]ULH16042.1 MBL fold metallo-hydrolase [Deinococcus sp. KNUC1210]
MPQLIDLTFQGHPGAIASYVLETGDGLVLVDTGPASTLPALEAGLERLGLHLQDVRHLLLTHIHLDHAGAVGTLLERLPAARVTVHQRGAAHLAAPERLMASAAQIYGDQMETLWGEMRPVNPAQMTVLDGGETLHLGGLEIRPLYTPGHAVHHLAYHIGPDLFVGDVGGIRLEAAQSPRPPTPPPDIDLPAWATSIALLRTVDAEMLHLAHFGSYPQEPAHWDALERNIQADAATVRRGLEAGDDAETITRDFTRALTHDLNSEGPGLAARFALACPPWMSVQGLTRYWKRAQARQGSKG